MPRPTSKELMDEQWKAEMARKDKLSSTGCLRSHCFHERADPKCLAAVVSRNMIRKCCRCPHVE